MELDCNPDDQLLQPKQEVYLQEEFDGPALTNRTNLMLNINSAGNAQDFGDLTVARNFGGCSDSHGGLGGF